jgi:hypothetical protein
MLFFRPRARTKAGKEEYGKNEVRQWEQTDIQATNNGGTLRPGGRIRSKNGIKLRRE